MTKIDIFSGFLGAGKTTLIKKLVKEAYGNEKIVLIENEFGEIGIDGGFLKDSGIQINEMNSGCICCTLVGDFEQALGKVIDEYSPDRIIIEPSGVGKLSDVILAVRNVKREGIELNGFTTVVDGKKCKMYMKNFGEFFNNQIEFANCVILSHTAGLSDEKLDKAVELVRENNKHCTVITTDWDKLTGKQILESIEKKDTLDAELKELEKEAHHGHHHHDEECCGHGHEHGHHHHDEECCGHGHEHGHHHHDEECCGHGHEHGHHHADEVFNTFGIETTKKFNKDELKNALSQLTNFAEYGQVLRAKGIVESDSEDWIHFDYVPGEVDIRNGSPATIGRLCVIGADIEEDKIKELLGF